MITLRAFHEHDVEQIQGWPAYAGNMSGLDYALRKNGWLQEFAGRPETFLFAFERGAELIAFTLLAKTIRQEAEFRIALRADQTGHGLGKMIAGMTLEKGFHDLGLTRIHLIVRKHHLRGINLYLGLGFQMRGACRKTIQGHDVEFWAMDMDRENYKPRRAAS